MCLGFVLEQLPGGDECTAEHAADRAKSPAPIRLSAPMRPAFSGGYCFVGWDRLSCLASGGGADDEARTGGKSCISRSATTAELPPAGPASEMRVWVAKQAKQRSSAVPSNTRLQFRHSTLAELILVRLSALGISCHGPIPGNLQRIRPALQAAALRRLVSILSAVFEDRVRARARICRVPA